MNDKRKPDMIDIYAGQRLHIRRSFLKMSQNELAEKADLAFRQIQKYEQGSNRMSVGRLYKFSKILDVPFDYFVKGFEEPIDQNDPSTDSYI